MQFRYKSDFLKRFDRLPAQDKELVISCDKQIRDYYTLHQAPYGLRIKKLYQSGSDKVLEARVSDKLRIVWVESGSLLVFSILGNHDEVRRYIKNLR